MFPFLLVFVFLFLAACAPADPSERLPFATLPAERTVLVDLGTLDAWEAFDGAGSAQCSFGPGGWSLRRSPFADGPAFCWLGLLEPVGVAEGAELALRATWTLQGADEGRFQAELEGASGDGYVDWAVLEGTGEAWEATGVAGEATLALRLALEPCEGCEAPAGIRVERLEVLAVPIGVE